MKKQIGIIFVYTAGWILIIIGVAAIFTPVIPGFLLIILGIYLISLKSIWVKTKLDQFIKKHPHLEQVIKKTNNWWLSLFVRIRYFFTGK